MNGDDESRAEAEGLAAAQIAEQRRPCLGCVRLSRRHCERDLRFVSGHDQRFASHQFDCWPVLAEKVRCVVEIARLHLNAAGLSAGAVRYFKVKIEAYRLRVLLDRLIVAAHLVSPPFCVAHLSLTIRIFVGLDYGTPCQKLRRPEQLVSAITECNARLVDRAGQLA
jgi:hypothetical protein